MGGMTKKEQMFRVREDLHLSYEDIGKLFQTPPTEVRKVVEQEAEAELRRQEELPSRNREIWRLRKEEGLTYAAIGKRFGISSGRTHQIVLREEQRLRREEWSARCRADSEAARCAYQKMMAEKLDDHLNRASASAALFDILFPEERERPVIVTMEDHQWPG
jgi:uncharacterized protein (DUF3084 family)